MKKILIIFCLIGSLNKAFAQEFNYLFDRTAYGIFEDALHKPGLNIHTAVKPYRMSDIKKIIDPDTAAHIRKPNSKSWFNRKLLYENFLKLDSADYQLYADPIFNFEAGFESHQGRNTWTNSRGLQLMGNIGKKVSFHTQFWENQAVLVSWVDSSVSRTNVVPGQGRVKPFGNGGYDYAFATGYISYTPSKYFNFQMGNDRVFIGDGHRSLMLSDNAFPNPFIRVTTTFWKIRYTNLFTSFQNIGNAANSPLGGYPKKYMSAHHLSINIGKRLNIGLFETVVWQAADTSGKRRGFDVNYMNPIIFFRPVEFSLGSPDNAIIGMNFKYIIGKNNYVYGQVVLDDFALNEVLSGDGWWGNKQAVQLGFRMFNIGGLKNLGFQTEFNAVRPYTYGHFTQTQGYSHFAQSLTHPVGANFIESFNFLTYRYKRLGFELRYSILAYGTDSLSANGTMSNVGQNIFVETSESAALPSSVPSIYNNRLLQGKRVDVSTVGLMMSYLVNPRTGMQLGLGVQHRSFESSGFNQNNTWFVFSFRTFMPNRNYDF